MASLGCRCSNHSQYYRPQRFKRAARIDPTRLLRIATPAAGNYHLVSRAAGNVGWSTGAGLGAAGGAAICAATVFLAPFAALCGAVGALAGGLIGWGVESLANDAARHRPPPRRQAATASRGNVFRLVA